MSTLINARDLNVKVGGQKIAHCTECRLSVNAELREKAGNTTWREYLAGLCDWSVVADGLLGADSLGLLRMQIARQKVALDFVIDKEQLSGEAWVGATSYGGGVKGKGTYNAAFTGNGEIS